MKIIKYMKIIIVLGLSFFLFINCQSIKPTVDYDTNTNFTNIKTYDYYTNNSIQLNQIDSLNFMKNLDNSLITKGLQRTSDNPDIYIAVMVSIAEGNDVNTVNLGVGGGSGWFGLGTNIGIPIKKRIINYTFQIDMDNAQTNQLIWTSKFSNTVDYNKYSNSKATLFQENINALVKNYPPKITKPKKKNYYN